MNTDSVDAALARATDYLWGIFHTHQAREDARCVARMAADDMARNSQRSAERAIEIAWAILKEARALVDKEKTGGD